VNGILAVGVVNFKGPPVPVVKSVEIRGFGPVRVVGMTGITCSAIV
jgi:hypothetical protein